MILKDFKVTAMATDITDLVQSMTLFESINGFMKGKIQILDGANFFDNDMGGRDEILIPITIDFRHLDFECTNHFWVDGVSQMKIDKSEKSYTMHLISPLEQGFKLNKICFLVSLNPNFSFLLSVVGKPSKEFSITVDKL